MIEMIWWTWSGWNRRPLPCHGRGQTANNRRHNTYESVQSAKPAQWAVFVGKMRATLQRVASGLICVGSAPNSLITNPAIVQQPAAQLPKDTLTTCNRFEPLESGGFWFATGRSRDSATAQEIGLSDSFWRCTMGGSTPAECCWHDWW
jgi:hypothetical protein